MKTSIHIKPDYNKLSDEELIRRYVELHEYNAYNQLFVRFGHMVYGMCVSLHIGNAATAKMKTEELFIAMLGDIKPLPKGGFKPWLYNYVIRAITGRYSAPQNEGAYEFPPLKEAHSAAIEGIPAGIATNMQQLTREEQQCIKLFYEQNKSISQISDETGMPIHSVKKLLHSGKDHLASQLSWNKQMAHVFDESNCLTRRQVKEYVAGQMETEESHAIEHHLNSCSLCSMAVDGLQCAPREAVMLIADLDTGFLHDHFSIAYPQVQVSSFVANSNPHKKVKTSRIPVWEQLLLALIVTVVVSVLVFTEKNNFHIPWSVFK